MVYRYFMNTPYEREQLPEGSIGYMIYKDEKPFHGWGFVDYPTPLNGNKVDAYDLDGPVVYL